MRFSSLKFVVAAFGLAAALTTADAIPTALADEVTTFAPGGVAIEGTDPVAYFTMGEPVVGSDAFTATHDGVTWKFASAENRDTFLADPAKYAPAYGGYYATGASYGAKVPTTPGNWKIVDGQLYLNSSRAAQSRFDSDTAGTIMRADQNWPTIMNTAN